MDIHGLSMTDSQVLPLFPTVIGPAGVDLSSRMVEKAAEREIYDALHCSDLVAFLRRQETASCDLLVATDVVMYLPLGSSGMKPFGVAVRCIRSVYPVMLNGELSTSHFCGTTVHCWMLYGLFRQSKAIAQVLPF